MSKYDPLRFQLERQRAPRVRMSFRQIEDILGFPLPVSARRHQPWWANTGGSHVHAEAWMKAGWRTSGVDLKNEQVTFNKDGGEGSGGSGPRGPGRPRGSRRAMVDLAALEAPVLAAVEEEAAAFGGDLDRAVIEMLGRAAAAKRRRSFDWFAANTRPSDASSADLIRQDRDER